MSINSTAKPGISKNIPTVKIPGKAAAATLSSVNKNTFEYNESNYNNSSSPKQEVVTEEMFVNKFKTIRDKCKKYGISDESVKQHFFNKIGLSVEKFEKCSLKAKYYILCDLEEAVNRQVAYLIETGKVKKHTNIEATIGMSAANRHKARNAGHKKDFDEITNEDKDSFQNEYKKCQTNEEKVSFVDKRKQRIIRKIENRRQLALELCGNNEAKKADINAHFDELREAVLSETEIVFVAQVEKEDAKFAVYFSDAKNFGEATNTVLELTKEEYKQEVANTFTYEFMMDTLKHFYENGDAIDAEQYGKAVEKTTAYKSKDAIDKYQQDSENFDSSNAPYYTEAHKNAQNKALQNGIAANTSLSQEEKASANNLKNNNVKVTIQSYQNTLNNSPVKTDKKQKTSDAKETPASQPVVTEAVLKSELKINSLKKVINTYPGSESAAVKLVLHNDKDYKKDLDDAIEKLKKKPAEDIGFTLIGCSYYVISKVLSACPSKSRDIMDIVAPYVGFAGKMLGEEKVEKLTGEKAA